MHIISNKISRSVSLRERLSEHVRSWRGKRQETTRSEVINIVTNLLSKKSPGFDGIPNFLLKKIILAIVDPLVHIFNISLNTGSVPNLMKIAKVVPLLKKGDNQLVSNYRPISLLTSLSKILEKLVHTRTCTFFKKKQYLFELSIWVPRKSQYLACNFIFH